MCRTLPNPARTSRAKAFEQEIESENSPDYRRQILTKSPTVTAKIYQQSTIVQTAKPSKLTRQDLKNIFANRY